MSVSSKIHLIIFIYANIFAFCMIFPLLKQKKQTKFLFLICLRWIIRFPIIPFGALQGNYLCVTW